jgi:hypothetical protein
MTYTVAVICGTDDNLITQPIHDFNVTHYVGEGNIITSSNANLQLDNTTGHSFSVTYYSTWPQDDSSWQGEQTCIVLGSHIAVTGQRYVVLTNGFKKVIGVDGLARTGSICALSVTYENSTSLRELDAGMEKMHEFDEDSVNMWAPISLFSDSSGFYMFYVGTGQWEDREDSSVRTNFLGIKKSIDGIDWVDIAKSEVYAHDEDHVLNDFLQLGPEQFQSVSSRTQFGERYFLGNKLQGKLIYSNSSLNGWTYHPIGRFNGLHWYNDSGTMYLCAVRIGKDGCFGTKICDAFGNMQPISWRRSATYWDMSINRLDAGYIARQVERLM